MPAGTSVVTCFLRDKSDVLLLHRSGRTPTYAGKWAGVSGLVESETPRETANREITEETGITTKTLIRTGEPFAVEDDPHVWNIHPFLFETTTRTVRLNKEHQSYTWTSPSEIPRLETVPCLWTTYQTVAPTIESLRTDTSHGSTYLSIRALEVLRDTATTSATTNGDPARITETARNLLNARPSMTAVANRINQVMTMTDDHPAEIETACKQVIERAYTADETAATAASEEIRGQHLLTHSRSSTVIDAISQSDARVTITESHPGDEGTLVAEQLAAQGHEVTLIADAATAHVLHDHDIDIVLFGADTILPDGSVLNKIGTRNIATAAQQAGIPVYTVTSTDKITFEKTAQNETGDTTELYNGPEPISVYNPRFDTTPPDLITAYITEQGPLEQDAIQTIATEHRTQSSWQETTP